MKSMTYRFILVWIAGIVLCMTAACHRPVEEAPVPPSPVSPNQGWIDWIKANHQPVRTLDTGENDDSDLEFLGPLLQGHSLVQLGESSHGVAEFNRAKVRLIKYLHARLGYDVIAFESSLFECFQAGEQMRLMTTVQAMRQSLFAVWNTAETQELFEYIKQTQNTERPLILVGFDNQISSSYGLTRRPEWFRRALAVRDPVYAREVCERDRDFVEKYRAQGTAFFKTNSAEWMLFFRELTDYFDTHMAELVGLHADEPRLPVVMRQTAWSMERLLEMLNQSDEYAGQSIRDRAMADNLDVLMQRLYPGRKIMLWAHNAHIMHNQPQGGQRPRPFTTMGSWLFTRHRPILYTIGLFMYQGEAATNYQEPYTIEPAVCGSAEELLAQTGQEYCLVDLLHQAECPGNSWMFREFQVRDWGVRYLSMVLRDQFDALFFVRTSHTPHYLTADTGTAWPNAER